LHITDLIVKRGIPQFSSQKQRDTGPRPKVWNYDLNDWEEVDADKEDGEIKQKRIKEMAQAIANFPMDEDFVDMFFEKAFSARAKQNSKIIRCTSKKQCSQRERSRTVR
jgi:hypothetical protein